MKTLGICGSRTEANNLGILFQGKTGESGQIYVIALYSLLTQQCIGYSVEQKESAMTAIALLPTDEKIAITGNSHGEVMLYPLKLNSARQNPLCVSYRGHKAGIIDISVRGSVSNPHYSLIATLDVSGVTCFWRVDAVGSDTTAGSIEEIVFGEYKLQLLENMDVARLAVPTGIYIDPKDSSAFMVMTEDGLHKNTRVLGMDDMCRKYEFKDLLYANPTAVAISDEGLFLVGFDNGSIGLYSQNFTIPLTIWQNVAERKIVCIKWSSVYFEDIIREHTQATEGKADAGRKDLPSKYKNNLIEFYVIDEKGDLQVWNLAKSVNKAVYTTDLTKIADLENATYEISYRF